MSKQDPIENLKHQDKVQEGHQHGDSSHALNDHVHDLRKGSDHVAVNDSTVNQGDAAYHAQAFVERMSSVHERMHGIDPTTGTSFMQRLANAEPDLHKSLTESYTKTAQLGETQTAPQVKAFMGSLRGAAT